MNVVKTVSATLLAAAALTGASGAFAATDPLAGQTNLMIAVWNPTTQTSWVQDLGSAASWGALNTSFAADAGFHTTFTIDGGHLTADLGSGTYQYALIAADYATGCCQYNEAAVYMSLQYGDTPPQVTNGDLVDGTIASLRQYINTYLPGSVTGVLSDAAAHPTSYFAFNPTGLGVNGALGINGWAGGAADTGALELVKNIGQAPDVSPTNLSETVVQNSQNVGKFTLDKATGTLTFDLAAVSQVPLPAAGWLLVSGLLGLGAVGRRRNGAANAA